MRNVLHILTKAGLFGLLALTAPWVYIKMAQDNAPVHTVDSVMCTSVQRYFIAGYTYESKQGGFGVGLWHVESKSLPSYKDIEVMISGFYKGESINKLTITSLHEFKNREEYLKFIEK